jgi:anti-sigma factor RsiW
MLLKSEECDRARRWVSLELDGELSELGQARLRAHLESCSDCVAYAGATRAATEQLRGAALEPAGFQIVLPQRRLPRRRLLQVGAAAAAVAVAIGLGRVAGSFSPSPAHRASAEAIAATQQPYLERQLLALDASLHKRMQRGRNVPV